MKPFELKNKRVTVVGLGLTGLSCVRFLLERHADVIAMDSRENLNVELSVPVYLGEYDPHHLLNAELVLLSPGVDPRLPAIKQAYDAGIEIIGDVELFARFNDKPVVAITGSNGKSTVTSLTTKMLNASGIKASMGGNIGTPVLELLATESDVYVLELSSFQLETVSSLNPLVATILNLCDDHLDRHQNMRNYQAAKQRIYRGAKYGVFNRGDDLTCPEIALESHSFGLDDVPCGYAWQSENQMIIREGAPYLAMADCDLNGTHNVLNIQAAALCASLAGANDTGIKQAARSFRGLPHRFETVAEQDQVRWINDSKATNVGAAVAAIRGLVGSIKGKIILIAGGEGKDADFSPLQPELEQHVSELITLGRDGRQIAALKPGSHPVSSLQDAVKLANELAQKGDAVLLAPACASFDMFKNYQHRGECFAQAVREVAS